MYLNCGVFSRSLLWPGQLNFNVPESDISHRPPKFRGIIFSLIVNFFTSLYIYIHTRTHTHILTDIRFYNFVLSKPEKFKNVKNKITNYNL